MTLIDVLASEYTIPPRQVRREGLAGILALYSAIAARYDMKPKGPTYVEQEMLDALARMESRIPKPEGKKRRRRKR